MLCWGVFKRALGVGVKGLGRRVWGFGWRRCRTCERVCAPRATTARARERGSRERGREGRAGGGREGGEREREKRDERETRGRERLKKPDERSIFPTSPEPPLASSSNGSISLLAASIACSAYVHARNSECKSEDTHTHYTYIYIYIYIYI